MKVVLVSFFKKIPIFLLHCLLIQEEIYVARAPGRLDVVGGIVDYSGSLVLQVIFFLFLKKKMKQTIYIGSYALRIISLENQLAKILGGTKHPNNRQTRGASLPWSM